MTRVGPERPGNLTKTITNPFDHEFCPEPIQDDGTGQNGAKSRQPPCDSDKPGSPALLNSDPHHRTLPTDGKKESQPTARWFHCTATIQFRPQAAPAPPHHPLFAKKGSLFYFCFVCSKGKTSS